MQKSKHEMGIAKDVFGETPEEKEARLKRCHAWLSRPRTMYEIHADEENGEPVIGYVGFSPEDEAIVRSCKQFSIALMLEVKDRGSKFCLLMNEDDLDDLKSLAFEWSKEKIYVFSHPFGGPEANDDGEYEVFLGTGVCREELEELEADESFRQKIVSWCESENCHRVAVSANGEPEGALRHCGYSFGFYVKEEGVVV